MHHKDRVVPRSRHHEKLPVRQTSKYLRGLFDRREVMIARHDQTLFAGFAEVLRGDVQPSLLELRQAIAAIARSDIHAQTAGQTTR